MISKAWNCFLKQPKNEFSFLADAGLLGMTDSRYFVENKVFSCVVYVVLAGMGRTGSTLAAETDFGDVEIDEVFLPYLSAEKRFMQLTGVKEFVLKDQKQRIIVSIVSTPSKGKNASAVAKMIKICRIKAQVELLKAEGYELSAFTKIEDRVVSIDDGQNNKIVSVSTYLNVAEEKVKGLVHSWPVVGTWFSKDGTEFYLAVGAVF